MKKTIFALACIYIMMIVSAASVCASTTQNFASVVRGDGWQRISLPEVRKTTTGNPWINWTDSDHGNTHKQWFTIVPKNASYSAGEIRLDGYGRSDISGHKTKPGNCYYLRSKREHFFDPAPYINGDWSPN